MFNLKSAIIPMPVKICDKKMKLRLVIFRREILNLSFTEPEKFFHHP